MIFLTLFFSAFFAKTTCERLAMRLKRQWLNTLGNVLLGGLLTAAFQVIFLQTVFTSGIRDQGLRIVVAATFGVMTLLSFGLIIQGWVNRDKEYGKLLVKPKS